jgi:hypothetical protein
MLCSLIDVNDFLGACTASILYPEDGVGTSFQKLMNNNNTACCHILEESNCHSHGWENQKPYEGN